MHETIDSIGLNNPKIFFIFQLFENFGQVKWGNLGQVAFCSGSCVYKANLSGAGLAVFHPIASAPGRSFSNASFIASWLFTARTIREARSSPSVVLWLFTEPTITVHVNESNHGGKVVVIGVYTLQSIECFLVFRSFHSVRISEYYRKSRGFVNFINLHHRHVSIVTLTKHLPCFLPVKSLNGCGIGRIHFPSSFLTVTVAVNVFVFITQTIPTIYKKSSGFHSFFELENLHFQFHYRF